MSDTKVKPVRAQSRLKSQSTLNREIKSMEVSSEAAAAVYINHQEKTRQKVNDKIQERLKKKQAAMAQKQIEKVYGDDKEIISETESTDADVENALSANILIVKKQKNPNRKSQPSAVAVVPTPVPIQAPAKQGNEVKSCCSKMLAILMWLFVGLLCCAGIIALIILILRLSPLPGGADDGENPIGNGNNTSPVHITTTTTAPPTPPTPPTTTPPPPPPTTTTTTTTTATPKGSVYQFLLLLIVWYLNYLIGFAQKLLAYPIHKFITLLWKHKRMLHNRCFLVMLILLEEECKLFKVLSELSIF
jgi:uncharacterized protein YdcH (DUF465 family)